MNTENNGESDGEMIMDRRLVPIRREGNIVFARSLRYGEEDTGEGVHLEKGDQLVIPAGELVVDTRDIDALSIPGEGGYAPVANTIWTWYRFAPVEGEFYLRFIALARRFDAAHALWALAKQEREKAKSEGGVNQRIGFVNTLAMAEVVIIALHRGMSMLHALNSKFGLELEVPSGVEKIWKIVRDMRHAFEHIDHRAEGLSGPSLEVDPDAWTIFDQPDFIDDSILRYKGDSLNFDGDVLTALLECRDMMIEAIDAKVKIDNASKSGDAD